MGLVLHPLKRRIHVEPDGTIGIERVQTLDDDFLRNLKASREKRSWRGEETLRVASVPLALVESLRQRGIDLMEMDVVEVPKVLRSLGYANDFMAYGGSL